MNHDWTIQHGTVELSQFRDGNVRDDYVGWLNDPDVVVETEQRAEQISRRPKYLFGTLCRPAVTLEISGFPAPRRAAPPGYLWGPLLRRYRGEGVGALAIDALINFALGKLNLHKVTAGIYANKKFRNHAAVSW